MTRTSDDNVRKRSVSQRSSALEACVAVILCAMALLFFYRTPLASNDILFTFDRFDPVIQASILEHWFGVFRGWYDWRNPIVFAPYQNVLGYNDSYFLASIPFLYSGQLASIP
ncbi:hypothetical protein CHELA1G11_20127 [Hyphomicrobiales bacterium]|nr:hypothetical protein CHELA1G11_20127 [Hyphomicrobiales bacterium]CAH1688793.1 hypothetical protein CHELA1G2_20443 [Hyphomicrobiales bacterium]